MGNTEKAAEALKTSIKLDPTFMEVKKKKKNQELKLYGNKKKKKKGF